MEKIKRESILIGKEYIEYNYAESKKKYTLCEMMQEYDRMSHNERVFFGES